MSDETLALMEGEDAATGGKTPAQESASWDEVKRRLAERQARRVPVWVNVGTKKDPVPARFVIRGLTSAEKDAIETRAVKVDVRARRDDMVHTDNTLVKRLTIQAGLVEGPPGWDKRTGLDIICSDPELRDDLAESIDHASTLDEETRIGFR